ncbi:MAG: ribose 5-phosphate isomerase B [Nannocystaceae bacterium]
MTARDLPRLHLGSDHAGIELRRLLSDRLRDAGYAIATEEGPVDPTDSVDYPDIAAIVARRVVGDPGSLGILVCGTGQGMAMTANRIPGARAGVCGDSFSAAAIREHNDANILCLGQRVLGTELAWVVLRSFLAAEFAGGRHARRVAKIGAAGGS